MLRNVIGVKMSQMSNQDKYEKVSLKEVVKRRGNRALEVSLAEYAELATSFENCEIRNFQGNMHTTI